MELRAFDFLLDYIPPGDKGENIAFASEWKAPVLSPKMVTIAPGLLFTVLVGPDYDAVTGAITMTVRNDDVVPSRFAAVLNIETDEAAPEDQAVREAYLVSTWPTLKGA